MSSPSFSFLLFFQESSPVPGSKIVIAREAFIDNTSRYSINGSVATQKDIIALLKSKGIDLDHNRFLILQGEVEQIALMKPKGSVSQLDRIIALPNDFLSPRCYAILS